MEQKFTITFTEQEANTLLSLLATQDFQVRQQLLTLIQTQAKEQLDTLNTKVED